MKIKLIVFLFFITSQTLADVQFYRCVDSSGKAHYSNIPLDMNADCQDRINRYVHMLEQDYQNLDQEYNKYRQTEQEEFVENKDAGQRSVTNIFDSDQALEQLLQVSDENRDSTASKRFRARSDAVERALEQQKQTNPSLDR